ncbi:MAG: hypothetical protein QM667_06980 [Asticcacaulis sp.]
MPFKAVLLAGLLATHGQPPEASASQQTDTVLNVLSPPAKPDGLRLTPAQVDTVLMLTDVLRQKAATRLRRITLENETAVYAQIRADWVIAINSFLNTQDALPDDTRKAMVADALHWAKVMSDKRSSAEMLRFVYRSSFEFTYSGEGMNLRIQ